MNSKVKLAVTVVVLIVIIVASKLLYDNFAKGSSAKLVDMTGSNQADVTRKSSSTKPSSAEASVNEIDLAKYKGSAASAEEPEPMIAPNFVSYDVNGNEINLDDFRGKPTVINFWASWCEPCKIEMPDFDTVYKEMEQDVNFVMVNLTDNDVETIEKATAFISEGGYSFPVYFDSDQSGAITYGIMSIPTTFFLNSDGYVVTGAQGAINEEMLRLGIQLATDYESPASGKLRK